MEYHRRKSEESSFSLLIQVLGMLSFLPRPSTLLFLFRFFGSGSCSSLGSFLFLFLVATKKSRDLAHYIAIFVNISLVSIGQSQIESSSVVVLYLIQFNEQMNDPILGRRIVERNEDGVSGSDRYKIQNTTNE